MEGRHDEAHSQGFDLLGEGVAGAGLLVCGDTGIEDGPEDDPI